MLFLLAFPIVVVSQLSIRKAVQQNDTSAIRELLEKSISFQFDNSDSAKVVAQHAIHLSEDADYEIGKAKGFNIIGAIYYY
ncbi:MAG: hypothetical protein P8X60_07795 [Robiginitalea sp.]